MRMIRSSKEMQSAALRFQMRGQSIGFVPTMGALHDGHRSLLRRARRENDQVIVSIFVNPLQFGPREDLKRYPRTLAKDEALLRAEEADILFVPAVEDMFPESFAATVDVPSLARALCGPFRPGHFRGVATVVAKLFQLAQPTRAYFGEKDYQQLAVIGRMVQDLSIPVRVVACPTVREKDGLACSSRNRYLSRSEREDAVKLYQTLYLGRQLVGEKIMLNRKKLLHRLKPVLAQIPKSRVDYIDVVDPLTLEPMENIRRPALLAAAVWIGKTRLIDNVMIS